MKTIHNKNDNHNCCEGSVDFHLSALERLLPPLPREPPQFLPLQLVELGAALAVGVVIRQVIVGAVVIGFVLADVLDGERDEVVPLVLVLLEHHLDQRVEGLVLTLIADPLGALVLDEVLVRLLTRLVDVVRALLEAELAHRADEEQRQPEGVHVQLERVEVLILRVPYEPQELGRAVLDRGEVHRRPLVGLGFDGVFKIAEQVVLVVDQDILGLNVAVRDALPLQALEHRQHLVDEGPDLLHGEHLDVPPAHGHVLEQVHLRPLHEQQQRPALPPLLALAALLHPQPLPLRPPDLRAVKAEPEQRGQIAALDLLDLPEHLEAAVAVGDLLDHHGHLGLEVLVGAHEVLAPADQLLVLELLQRVEVERLYLLASARPHHIRDQYENILGVATWEAHQARRHTILGRTAIEDMGQPINYDHISMSRNLQLYKNLRVYRHLSIPCIFNHLICNRVMKSKTLVAAAPALYRVAARFPGKTLTHWLIATTFNRVFTGGNRIEDLEASTRHLAERGIPIIIDFCAEGTRNHIDSDNLLDENARQFTESAVVAARIPNQLMSIKVSALVNLNLLEKFNRSVLLRDNIWREFSKDGRLTAQGIFDGLFRIYAGVTTEDITSYVKNIHGFAGSELSEFQIDQIGFKMNHQPFYLYEPQKNDDLIIKVLLPLDLSERQQLGSMKLRLDQILDKQYQNPNNLRVLADAEQSFIQRAIECICEQLQAKYNRSKPYLITTLQNYLKIAPQRVDFELELTKRRSLFLAMKLVRGAYLVEESKVSQESRTENPIVDSFEATTSNYLRNFQKIIQQDLKGEIFAATHNEATIEALLELRSKASPGITINFAQLFGLADHLTFMLKDRRVNVYKLLPWAQTEVMVGYMIRRAEELSQTNYPLEIQHKLLTNELKARTLSMG